MEPVQPVMPTVEPVSTQPTAPTALIDTIWQIMYAGLVQPDL